MARSRTQTLPLDRMVTEQSWHRGMVSDSDPPVGSLLDVKDWLVEQPGKIYKRGGWERHSDSNGACTGMLWVGTIQAPTRVVAIGDDLNLYDVTSENSPTSSTIGAIGFAPKEKSPSYKEQLVLCDPDAVIPPKTVAYATGPDALVIDNLDGSPPAAAHSTIHNGFVVLGRGAPDFSGDFPFGNVLTRLWFQPNEADIVAGRPSWDTDPGGAWIDTSYEITALVSTGGVLLIFSPHHVERILGGESPGVDHSNKGTGDMVLQPLLGVGCLDARSIAFYDDQVIFAGEDGVWLTNGSGITSLTEKPDATGIQSFWRSLFPRHHTSGQHNFRGLVGGMLGRDFYLISILDENNNFIESLLCHVPSRAWTRVTNLEAASMAEGRDEQEIAELYFAEARAPYVSRAVPILYPTERNIRDGNSGGPVPFFLSRDISQGSFGLKSYGFGFVTYQADEEFSVEVETGVLRNTGSSDIATIPASEQGRKRIDIFRDSQAAWWYVLQTNPGVTTEIYYLEAETREYPPQSDSLGA